MDGTLSRWEPRGFKERTPEMEKLYVIIVEKKKRMQSIGDN